MCPVSSLFSNSQQHGLSSRPTYIQAFCFHPTQDGMSKRRPDRCHTTRCARQTNVRSIARDARCMIHDTTRDTSYRRTKPPMLDAITNACPAHRRTATTQPYTSKYTVTTSVQATIYSIKRHTYKHAETLTMTGMPSRYPAEHATTRSDIATPASTSASDAALTLTGSTPPSDWITCR